MRRAAERAAGLSPPPQGKSRGPHRGRVGLLKGQSPFEGRVAIAFTEDLSLLSHVGREGHSLTNSPSVKGWC